MTDYSKLERELQEMPDWIAELLKQQDLLRDYHDRPPYQQNDYLAWIKRAKRDATRQKRAMQMIAELKKGGVYMKMDHPASEKSDDH